MRILGIAGRKQSGKSSTCSYIMGLEMQRLEIIDRFDIDDEGKLLVNHDSFVDDEGKEVPAGMGPFDFERRDTEFMTYCSQLVWPHAKIYSFAEVLKWIAVNMYRIEPHKVYGTDAQKEEFTEYSWEDLKPIVPPKNWPKQLKTPTKKLTGRQFLQLMGDVLRQPNDHCFIDVTMNQVIESMVPLSLISDCRRVDEMKRIRAAGGKIIYLGKKKAATDNHRTEKEFDNIDISQYADVVIDNQNMTVTEKNAKVFEVLNSWGWLN